MPRIFHVDDHPMLRDGFAHLIEQYPAFEMCGGAGSAADALERIPRLKPDLVVMDISLPDKNGVELIKDLRALCGEIPIIVLSMHDEMLYAERVIRAGGRGYLMKESVSDKVMEAMKTVLEGRIYLSPHASAHILGGLSGKRNSPQRSSLERLSDREFEVFELVGRGKSTHEIGDLLHISPRTVDAHRNNIRKKLQLPDSSALLRYAVRWVEAGLASGDDSLGQAG